MPKTRKAHHRASKLTHRRLGQTDNFESDRIAGKRDKAADNPTEDTETRNSLAEPLASEEEV